MTETPRTQVDATGLLCPLPLMHLKKAVANCVPGDWVVITVTDVHAELDFETWCERFGHELQRGQDRGEVMEFMIRVGAP
jgi:tRNA 2-thiouridine synthesizing protein A